MSNTKLSWTAVIEADPNNPNECILVFPDDMIAHLGWKEGDELDWEELDNGNWCLKKVNKD